MGLLRSSCLILALMAAACDRLAPPPQPAPAPVADEATPIPDLQAFVGRSYGDFADAHSDRVGNDALGAGDAQRLRGLLQDARGALLDGGGAQALLFRGCAATGCADGVAIVAVEGTTGAAFAGIRDGDGRDVLLPNERLEALLRLNAPTRDWADAGAGESPAAAVAAPERP